MVLTFLFAFLTRAYTAVYSLLTKHALDSKQRYFIYKAVIIFTPQGENNIKILPKRK